MSCFYTARKKDTLNNETNSIKEQERMGNNWVTGNIMGTILGYIMFCHGSAGKSYNAAESSGKPLHDWKHAHSFIMCLPCVLQWIHTDGLVR